jgi:putative ABC transport system permease protein
MKSLKYIWRNVTRNKLRSSLTILSVGFSLALLTILHGYLAMQRVWGAESEKYNRVVVMNIQGFSGRLPIAMIEKIRGMEGVKDVVPFSWFGGNYGEEQMPFTQFGTDADHVFNVWEEFKIDPEQLKRWQTTQQGCVVDRELADKRGWKIGDRIRIEGTYYPVNLDLELCGVFDPPGYTDFLWFHWSYLNEGLKQQAGPRVDNSGTIWAKTTGKDVMPRVIDAIDAHFASSETPTRTQSEAAFAQMFNDMVGNIQLYILFIGAAVVFALALVTGNTMAMAVRERTTEVAVLKAIGFPRGRVLGMILGEGCMIALLGGILGVGIGCAALEGLHRFSAQIFPLGVAPLVGPWLASILAVALGIGLVSGIIPALLAARASVVDGLRRVV